MGITHSAGKVALGTRPRASESERGRVLGEGHQLGLRPPALGHSGPGAARGLNAPRLRAMWALHCAQWELRRLTVRARAALSGRRACPKHHHHPQPGT